MSKEAQKRERRDFRRWALVLTASLLTSGMVVVSMMVLLTHIQEAFHLPLDNTFIFAGIVLMALVWFLSTSCVILAVDQIHRFLWPEQPDDDHEP